MNIPGLWQQLSRNALRYPERLAVCGLDNEYPLTFSELVEHVEKLTDSFVRLPHHCIALLADNGPSWIIADLAAQASGKCLVPLPTFFSPSQLLHAMDDAGVSQLLIEAGATFHLGGFAIAESSFSSANMMLMVRQPFATPALPPETVKITYTSGSTGTPRGVCLGETQIQAVSRSLADLTSPMQVQRHLCVLPLATLLENIAGVYVPLLQGATVIVPRLAQLGFTGSSGLDPLRFLATIRLSKAQSIILTPQLLEVVLQAIDQGVNAVAEMKFIAVGGGKVSTTALHKARRSGLPVYEGYGLSEGASVVSLNTPAATRPGSAGKPLPHVRVTVENGEVVIEGNTFLGYCGEQSVPSRSKLYTGDLGHLDQDGFLYIDGRSKNILISSFGRNISPEWLEAELSAAAEISQCVVFGDARPHCVALLYARDCVTDAALQFAVTSMNSNLPDYARVVRWFRIPAPLSTVDGTLTANGRLRRDAIAARFASQIESLYSLENYSTTPVGTYNPLINTME